MLSQIVCGGISWGILPRFQALISAPNQKNSLALMITLSLIGIAGSFITLSWIVAAKTIDAENPTMPIEPKA